MLRHRGIIPCSNAPFLWLQMRWQLMHLCACRRRRRTAHHEPAYSNSHLSNNRQPTHLRYPAFSKKASALATNKSEVKENSPGCQKLFARERLS